MTAALTANQQRILSTASRSGIENAFQALYPHFLNRQWTGPNVYKSNTIRTIGDDVSRGSIRHVDLAQYIAVSAPIHCADGWGYLGRAISCLSQGDVNSARHLGYYAELRAAMSLLASCGIGIFDHDHIVVDSLGTCVPLPLRSGTHPTTWLVLEYWTTLPDAWHVIGEIIRPLAIPLTQWLSNFAGGAVLSAIAADWIKSWGLDLRTFKNDREARNNVSYRPSRLDYSTPLGVSDRMVFLNELWSLASPTLGSRFDKLDRFLLRKSLSQAFTATPAVRPTGLRPRVEKALSSLLSTSAASILVQYADFLSDDLRNPDPMLMIEANKSDPLSNPQHPLQVIARAFLLLRLATGSASHLISALPSPARDLDFWWKPLGIETGIWDQNTEPGSDRDDIIVLWDDVQDALEDLEPWTSKVKSSSCNALFSEHAKMLWVLQGCERIAMWGLLP